jgi:L-threonylcarbamoyladenylate synthase
MTLSTKEIYTEILDADSNRELALVKACGFLSGGEVVGFPTETVYGIGADIYNKDAVKKIFLAKDRDQTNPLAAHISSLDQVSAICRDIPAEFFALAEKFLPGPLSIVMKKNSKISDIVTAGRDTVAIRYPDNATAIALIGRYGKPLAATSANISGRTSPVTAAQALDHLRGRIPLILDGGPAEFGLESTVLDLSGGRPKVLRLGAVGLKAIEEVLNINLSDSAV